MKEIQDDCDEFLRELGLLPDSSKNENEDKDCADMTTCLNEQKLQNEPTRSRIGFA